MIFDMGKILMQIYFVDEILEGSEFNYTNKYLLIRHRLDSFVGPNKKLYQVIYNDGVDPNIDIIGNIIRKNVRRKKF